MRRLAVVVMVIVMAIPVLYIGSTFYAAYFFEHDFTPVESEGTEAASELRYWLGDAAGHVTEPRGFRYKSGMPPMPIFYYRFGADPATIAALADRFEMATQATPSEPPSGEQLPDWWRPPVADVTFRRGHDKGNPILLWYQPGTGTAYLYMRVEG